MLHLAWLSKNPVASKQDLELVLLLQEHYIHLLGTLSFHEKRYKKYPPQIYGKRLLAMHHANTTRLQQMPQQTF